MSRLDRAPTLSVEQAQEILGAAYELQGRLEALPSERDQNFRVDTDTQDRFVLKIANADEATGFLEAQDAMLVRIAERVKICPRLVPTRDGRPRATTANGEAHAVRLVTYLPGVPLAKVQPANPALLTDLGRRLGQVDEALTGFDHPSLHRRFEWNLAEGFDVVSRYASLIDDPDHRRAVREAATRVEKALAPRRASLRVGAIHNDANDYNVIVEETPPRVVGLIDFGDVVHSWIVGELAIATAYAMLDAVEPLDVLAALVAGYHEAYPLRAAELEMVYGLACLRLCVSASMAAHQRRQRPDDPYLEISQGPLRRTLPRLLERPLALGQQVALDAAAGAASPRPPEPTDRVATRRATYLSGTLSVGYRTPVHLRRGHMQYLYDAQGRRFLDAYNNVPHVGHCPPANRRRSGREQMAPAEYEHALSLSRRCLDYAGAAGGDAARSARGRATSSTPASEANELALRIARAHDRGSATLSCSESAYHGHTTTMIDDQSVQARRGPAAPERPGWVHVTAAAGPTLRGIGHRENRSRSGLQVRRSAVEDRIAAIEATGRPCRGLHRRDLSERGRAGVSAARDILAEVYEPGTCRGGPVHRRRGADRIRPPRSKCFYAFEPIMGWCPDVVVLGKPIGNGHPIGAVVTTEAIAAAFETGMEFFSTFGGNTVSCEVGLAVLDVVEDEGLMEHARTVGDRLRAGFEELARQHAGLSDVRGRGLFFGLELVDDPDSRQPDAARASAVINAMRDAGVLIGTDGPDHNVLKVRPPMPFDTGDADRLLQALADALSR